MNDGLWLDRDHCSSRIAIRQALDIIGIVKTEKTTNWVIVLFLSTREANQVKKDKLGGSVARKVNIKKRRIVTYADVDCRRVGIATAVLAL